MPEITFIDSCEKKGKDYIPSIQFYSFSFHVLVRKATIADNFCSFPVIYNKTGSQEMAYTTGSLELSFQHHITCGYGDDHCAEKQPLVTFHFSSGHYSSTSWTGRVSSCKALWEMESTCDLWQLWKNWTVSLASSWTGLPKASSCSAPSLPRDVWLT